MFFKGEQGLLGLVYKTETLSVPGASCQLGHHKLKWFTQYAAMNAALGYLLPSPMIHIIPLNKSKQTVAKYANPLSTIKKCIQIYND